MIYAIPCNPETHDLLEFLFGEIPEYQESEINTYMLFDPKDSSNNRLVDFYDLYNQDGTEYTINDLVILH